MWRPSVIVSLVGLLIAAATPSVAQVSVTCGGEAITISGTSNDDVITGTAGSDVINARAGDDIINALGGSDRICGGNGSDRLIGGPDDDLLNGGAGSNTVDFTSAPASVTADLENGSAAGWGASSSALTT
jgi:Ca2+-binding RTX toxin-like protein